jgi:DNA-binding NtrC family response regulator
MKSEDELISNSEYGEGCVLLVEDDPIVRFSLADRFKLEGIPVVVTEDISSAKIELKASHIDLIVTDIRLPDGTGIEFFHYVSKHFPGIPVLLMTAYGEISDVVHLVKSGALDYLIKPFDITEFISKVKHHLSNILDRRIILNTTSTQKSFKPGSGHLGKSPSMRRIERLVSRLSDNDSTILLTGESGVGKEVIANLIQSNSPRANGPFIKVNCAALSPTLIESELFGHEKGAFTGASHQAIGRFEQANGGTIFLDEIGEISPDIQIKLLRVLQEREINRVGSVKPIQVDIRIITATQLLLEEAIKKGTFRSDLYWRLNVIHIEIPPLRQRKEDIVYLARQFADEFSSKSKIKGLSKQTELMLLSHTFSGNVRELKNMIERAFALSDGPWLKPGDLYMMETEQSEQSVNCSATLKDSLEKAECLAINEALTESSGKIINAAETLDISRKSLWEKMKRYKIENTRK